MVQKFWFPLTLNSLKNLTVETPQFSPIIFNGLIRTMQFNILTLFPEYFESPFQTSLLGKAIENGIININLVNIRDFANNRHGKVDDAPYGGGSGMVLMIEPVDLALQSLTTRGHVILLTPRGYPVNQQRVTRITENHDTLTLICGHYEGFDERIARNLADESLSVGNFIMSGGEPAAASLVDAIARNIPGFMGNTESLHTESFTNSESLEYAQYTRPAVYKNMSVPEVLLSGNHAAIQKWRSDEAILASRKFLNSQSNCSSTKEALEKSVDNGNIKQKKSTE